MPVGFGSGDEIRRPTAEYEVATVVADPRLRRVPVSPHQSAPRIVRDEAIRCESGCIAVPDVDVLSRLARRARDEIGRCGGIGRVAAVCAEHDVANVVVGRQAGARRRVGNPASRLGRRGIPVPEVALEDANAAVLFRCVADEVGRGTLEGDIAAIGTQVRIAGEVIAPFEGSGGPVRDQSRRAGRIRVPIPEIGVEGELTGDSGDEIGGFAGKGDETAIRVEGRQERSCRSLPASSNPSLRRRGGRCP